MLIGVAMSGSGSSELPLQKKIEFYLRLCFDVLFEVFRFGCRRKLTKLERVGLRFHWLIEKYFPDVPFLRLDLELNPRFVYAFLSIHRWPPKKNQESSKLAYKRYRYLLIIKSIIHSLYTHCRSQECQVLRPPPTSEKKHVFGLKNQNFSCCVD